MVSSDHKKLKLLLKDCANGFYQQMYFLGKDVIHSNGNQLIEYGFVKSPSKGLKGTSCYTYESTEGTLELYGSCAGYYSTESRTVFLRKRCRFYQWLPNHRLVAGCWSQEDLLAENPYQTFDKIVPFLEWWLTYEKWIESRFGEEYREQCYVEWGKVKSKTPWLSPLLAREWVENFLERRELHVRPRKFTLSLTK